MWKFIIIKSIFQRINGFKAGSLWHRGRFFVFFFLVLPPMCCPLSMLVNFVFPIFKILYIYHLLLVNTPVFIVFDNYWNRISMPVQLLKRETTDSLKIKSRNTFLIGKQQIKNAPVVPSLWHPSLPPPQNK